MLAETGAVARGQRVEFHDGATVDGEILHRAHCLSEGDLECQKDGRDAVVVALPKSVRPLDRPRPRRRPAERFRVALIGGFALPFHGVQRATGDIDFLADACGSAALHDALLAAGARCLHRSADAANYARGTSRLSPVDFIFARRERALDMLRRAGKRLLRGARLRVPVVDAEALIGLKLQALVNAPSRRALEEADIQALFAAHGASLNADLLRDYFVKRPEDFIIGAEVPDQASARVPERVRDLDEFLAFLAQLEAVFGPIERRRHITTGDHFLL